MDAAGADHDSDGESTLGESQFDEKDALQVQKLDDIRFACEARDVIKLQALAGSRGGFLTDALRKSACKFYGGTFSRFFSKHLLYACTY